MVAIDDVIQEYKDRKAGAVSGHAVSSTESSEMLTCTECRLERLRNEYVLGRVRMFQSSRKQLPTRLESLSKCLPQRATKEKIGELSRAATQT